MRKALYIIIGLLSTLSANAQVEISSEPEYESIAEMLRYAETLVRRPYRSGAEGPYAFDCSGFTRFCYKKLGIKMERTSKAQAEQGKRIRRKKRIMPGDLVCYKGSTGKEVGHVGIVLRKTGDGTFDFIHASSSVGITITNSETKYFSDRYVKTMRITRNKDIIRALKESGKEVKMIEENRRKAAEADKTRKEKKEAELEPQETIKKRETTKEQSKKETKEKTNKNEAKNNNEKKEKKTDNAQKKAEEKKEPNKEQESEIKEENKPVQDSVTKKDTTVNNTENEGLKTLPGKTYVVKKGDTMYNIARRVPCTVNDLQRMNNMQDFNLSIGQEIIIRE